MRAFCPGLAASLLLVLAGCATAGVTGLHVESRGAGAAPPVVFVHGLGGDTDTWAEAMTHLAPSRRVVAFDARNHGQSARGPATLAQWSDDLFAVVQDLHLKKVVVVGHSMAGCVLQRFAAEHRELVAGLVFVDAIGDFSRAGTKDEVDAFALAQRRPTTLDERRAQFTELLASKARPETNARVLRSLGHLDGAAWSTLREDLARFTPPPFDASIPTLAIEAAGNDAPVRYSALRPDVPRVDVPSSSHWLMLDQPEAFARALDDFLAAGRSRPRDAR